MNLSELEKIEIGAWVKKNYPSNDPGPFLVVGEIYWGMHSCGRPPSRKLFLYDPKEECELGEFSENCLVKVEVENAQ